MARSRLRVYYGPETSPAQAESNDNHRKVQVPISEIFPLLAEAVRNERTWLRDFADEEISISTDLYEVILAYQFCRRPSA